MPTTRPSAPAPRQTLDAMGVTPLEERAYRLLLRHDGLPPAEIARRLDLTPRRAAAVLRALGERGMVSHTPDRPPRYFAAPPDVAVEALIAASQRDEERRQQRARAAIATLGAAGVGAVVRDERLVEILGPSATAQLFVHMHRTVREELLSLTRRPMLISNIAEPDHLLFDALSRGVRCRALIDSDLLSMPGWTEHMRDNAARGEECRIAASLPFKLVIADRRMAIIPLDLERPDGPVLLVRPSSLLDALCEIFDMLWRAATPYTVAHDEDAGTRDALLSLLTSGLNDKAIQLELGISHRTLARRISGLMKELGAATRCQLGFLAAQRSAVR
ncbi:sugar-specific transcriptional regulator TrmB [Dokdonella fugitiva]|uniref:Sugar-specific transcriptional regulator TrmB n=1 Tax=Dokdonella fugitiva TaxID=328517 RepID=A0A839F4J3_9GAMM|nr:helix-turn-helix domain-containing protein [Dokdonella fugitiva]MBA8887121.1 sugar-specific transcriptional regulator TrmB [Dokdonella fugitiva]